MTRSLPVGFAPRSPRPSRLSCCTPHFPTERPVKSPGTHVPPDATTHPSQAIGWRGQACRYRSTRASPWRSGGRQGRWLAPTLSRGFRLLVTVSRARSLGEPARGGTSDWPPSFGHRGAGGLALAGSRQLGHGEALPRPASPDRLARVSCALRGHICGLTFHGSLSVGRRSVARGDGHERERRDHKRASRPKRFVAQTAGGAT